MLPCFTVILQLNCIYVNKLTSLKNGLKGNVMYLSNISNVEMTTVKETNRKKLLPLKFIHSKNN